MCHFHLSKAAACLLAAWVPIPCQCNLQAAWTSHSEYKRYRMLTRPIFTSCAPAINNAFCECIAHCHLSRAPTCMHDSQVRVSRRPAYSGPLKPALTSQAPASDAWDAPLLLPCQFLHFSSRAACLLLDTGMRRTRVPTSSQPLAPQRHARQFNPRPHRSAPSDASV